MMGDTDADLVGYERVGAKASMPDVSPVAAAVKDNRNAISELAHLVEMLTARLEPVLVPPTPPSDAHDEASPLEAPLIGDLRGIRIVITRQSRALSDLLDRLQL